MAVADAGLEVVERANRRAADALALEVVNAAVAGADEVAGGLDEADRATEVGAAVGDSDELAGFFAQFLGALTDVGGGLAGVADPLGFGEDDLAVGVFDEVGDRSDRLPTLLAAVEDRRDREADGRQDDPGASQPANSLGANREGATARHRLPLEIAGRVGLRPLRDGRLLGPVYLVRVVCHRSVRVGRPSLLLRGCDLRHAYRFYVEAWEV